jgi:hypothetical protein
MAAPHIAGLAALILQAKPKADPDEVQTLLMNTSAPIGVNVAPNAGLEPTWRQGSGLAMVDRAVLTPASVTPAKLSLGEGNGGSAKLTVTNDGRSPVTYDLSGVSTVATGPSGNPAAVFPYTFAYLLGDNPAAFSTSSVTVPARGQATFRVTLAPSALLPDRSLYGGYVVLSPRGGGITLRVPYVGFKGDYQSLPVLTSAACGFPGVFQIRATGSDACLGRQPTRGGGSDVHAAGRGLPDPALPPQPPGPEAEPPGPQAQRPAGRRPAELRRPGGVPAAKLPGDLVLRVRLGRHPLPEQGRQDAVGPAAGRPGRHLRPQAERPQGARGREQPGALGDLYFPADHAGAALRL